VASENLTPSFILQKNPKSIFYYHTKVPPISNLKNKNKDTACARRSPGFVSSAGGFHTSSMPTKDAAWAGTAKWRSPWPVEEHGRGEEGLAALDLAGGGCGRGRDGQAAFNLAGGGRSRAGMVGRRSIWPAEDTAGIGTAGRPSIWPAEDVAGPGTAGHRSIWPVEDDVAFRVLAATVDLSMEAPPQAVQLQLRR
jgi:hypothetical protein